MQWSTDWRLRMGKPKKLIGVQQNLIHTDKDTQSILEYICGEANKVHNCAVYYARQIWFKTRRFVTGFDLVKEIGSNKHFSALPSDAAVQACLSVGESVNSFAALLKKSRAGELEQKPRFPGYRLPGYQLVTFPRRALKLVDGKIRFPLGQQVYSWFGLKDFYLPMPTNLDFATIKEIRILPRNRQFYAEFVYQVSPINVEVDKSKVLGIDHGIDNWLTCISNVGTSFIVDGLHLKSLNQWYKCDSLIGESR
jgi:putative transposase